MMRYKGYYGRVEFDDEAGLLHGEVIGIRDVVTFQGKTVPQLRKAFRDSVDDYLEFCQKRGEPPDKPASGRFVLRLDPELHHRVQTAAQAAGESINAWVADQLKDSVERALTG